MTDTHCHLYLEAFKTDIHEVIARARMEHITQFYLPAIDSNNHHDMMLLEEKFPGECHAMMGLHPCSVKENYLEELEIAEQYISKRPFCAIGEIGLDFYWDKSFEKQQYDVFRKQMQWALDLNIPISIHTRNAMQETINEVRPFAQKGLKGIFHCFSGSHESASQIIAMGFLLGIGGVVTYKNAGLGAVLARIDLEHLVLETDAPYLTPVPFRGKRNESSYLKYIAEKIALAKNCTLQEVKDATTTNSQKIFRS
jgi:TatD DNase family protein